jgi:hypothetical protein
LKQLKIRLQNTKAWYGGEELTLWRLADTNEQGYLQFSRCHDKFEKLYRAISDTERLLYSMVCDVNMRESYNRQMTNTTLGTFA